MEFFMDMELVPGEGGNGPKGGVLTGFLILEATENDKPVCSRKYTVEYAMVPSGRRWSQRAFESSLLPNAIREDNGKNTQFHPHLPTQLLHKILVASQTFMSKNFF